MMKQQINYLLPASASKRDRDGYYYFSDFYNVYPFNQFLETKGAITRPAPIPIKIDATNNRADVLSNIKPTPTPMIVVPPTTHELLSFFISTSKLLYLYDCKDPESINFSFALSGDRCYKISPFKNVHNLQSMPDRSA